VTQGVRGADIHQIVVDSRGARCGAILWECKNARNWSEAWVAKLKEDQRALRADVAVLVTACLPKGCSRFTVIDGVLVADFACAAPLASVLRANLIQLAQTRNAAINKGEKLELLHRYLSGVEFRQRVEGIVEAFARMREDLDLERRVAERQWAKRAKQIEAVTFNISGMYGDLQGLVPALPSIARLELEAGDAGSDAGSKDPAYVPGRPGLLFLRVRFDVLDRFLDAGDLLGVVVGNFDPELFFERHDELHRVERVGAEVVDERRVWRHFFFVHAQLFHDDALNLVRDGHSALLSDPAPARPYMYIPPLTAST
jgi:hypothetical protein